jgi:eukaryotic-like serine/threonine-protein kinase
LIQIRIAFYSSTRQLKKKSTAINHLELMTAKSLAYELERKPFLLLAELALARKKLGSDSFELRNKLITVGKELLAIKKYSLAEPILRECLSMTDTKYPTYYGTFDAKALVGFALLGQKKYPEAELYMKRGIEGMTKVSNTIPKNLEFILTDARERLYLLYLVTDRLLEARAVRASIPREQTPKARSR